jgi:L-lactate dehydrogenase complex protein LldG
MSARDRILARLKAGAPSTAGDIPDVAAWYAAHRAPDSAADRISRFRHCIELAHAEVHAVLRGRWIEKLHEVLAARQIASLLVGPGTVHGARAQAELPARGIDCRGYEHAIESWKPAMFTDTPAALTAARAAIAETGTLIVWPDADEPRLMSLVPPLHVVLLDGATIYNTLHEAIAVEGWKAGLPTNALLISGPSKTADIQQTLAYGAHGPKELVVLLLGDER